MLADVKLDPKNVDEVFFGEIFTAGVVADQQDKQQFMQEFQMKSLLQLLICYVLQV
jgi:hypothetical protein